MRYAIYGQVFQVSLWILAISSARSALWAQTIDHTAGFGTNHNADLTKNGSTSFGPTGAASVTRLTGAANNEAGTVWHTSKVDIQFFTNTFQFQFHGG